MEAPYSPSRNAVHRVAPRNVALTKHTLSHSLPELISSTAVTDDRFPDPMRRGFHAVGMMALAIPETPGGSAPHSMTSAASPAEGWCALAIPETLGVSAPQPMASTASPAEAALPTSPAPPTPWTSRRRHPPVVRRGAASPAATSTLRVVPVGAAGTTRHRATP